MVSSYVRKLSSFILLGILLFQCPGLAAQTPRPDPQSKPGSVPGDINNIQHIVFIIKENRTFDQYFGTYPGANGATSAVMSTGQTVHLVHAPDPPPRDISHGWFDAVQGVDYFKYAQHFVLADNMFSSIQGASFVNHLYTVGAQSSNIFTQPSPSQTNGGSCDSIPGTFTYVWNDDNTVTQTFPCVDFTTLADELQSAGVSWKFYASLLGQPGYPFTTLAAISHIRFSSLWNNVVDHKLFNQDAQSGNLPAVS